MAEDLVNGWSCDQRHRGDGCRDPHGCHCREITAQAASLAAKDKEIERLRSGINGVVNCQGSLTRNQVRGACAEILNNETIGMYNQSPFVAALSEYKARAEQAERALAEAVEILSIWSHDGSLQTFEHREKFRKVARAFVAQHGSDSREGK